MIRTTLATVTAVLLTAVVGVAPPAGAAIAAPAAACSGDSGVTVIVDFNELGGGLTAACAADGAGKDASQVFTDAGYPLTYVQEDPGFICRVSGKPADNPCARTPPTTAYWSLWWSDGETGNWVYSSSGVNTLQVPDGGYLAFAWHQGSGNAGPPDVNPTPHQSPEPSDEPSDGGGGGGDGGGQGDNASDGGSNDPTSAPSTSAAPTTTAATESASESASPERRKKRRDRERDEPTATSTDAVPAADEITDGPPPSDLASDSSGDDDGALSTWIGLGLAVLVLGAAGLVTVLRRRAG